MVGVRHDSTVHVSHDVYISPRSVRWGAWIDKRDSGEEVLDWRTEQVISSQRQKMQSGGGRASCWRARDKQRRLDGGSTRARARANAGAWTLYLDAMLQDGDAAWSLEHHPPLPAPLPHLFSFCLCVGRPLTARACQVGGLDASIIAVASQLHSAIRKPQTTSCELRAALPPPSSTARAGDSSRTAPLLPSRTPKRQPDVSSTTDRRPTAPLLLLPSLSSSPRDFGPRLSATELLLQPLCASRARACELSEDLSPRTRRTIAHRRAASSSRVISG